MKIRNRRLLAAAGWGATQVARGIFRTLRFRYEPLGPSFAPAHVPAGERIVYCIWHENLLLPALYFGCPDVAVLISQHRDGQLLGSLIQSVGMGMVCGSSTRGGADAVRRMVRDDFPFRHLAVTPDGPRGPRRVVQQGLAYVASRTGMKVVCVGVGYRRPWRLNSWDRFAVPKPFTRARCLTGDPIAVPAGVRSAALEPYRLLIQTEMDRLNAAAEGWVETGRLDVPKPQTGPRLRLAS